MRFWQPDDIKELRWRLGWSQAELARRLGCRQQTISEWERGLYAPQNAYSRLLDMLSDQGEVYSYQVVRDPLADAAMKDSRRGQVLGVDLPPVATDFDPQID